MKKMTKLGLLAVTGLLTWFGYVTSFMEAINLAGLLMMYGGLFVFFYKIGLVIDKYLSEEKKKDEENK